MHRMLIHRVGVSGHRFLPLYELVIEKYGRDRIVATTDNDLGFSKFASEMRKLIDIRTLFIEDIRFKCANKYNPADASLIQHMAPYLHNIIEIEGRNRKNENYLSRINYYYDFLGYWSGFLDEYNISIFLCESLPHEFHGLLLYYLCKCKNIRTIVMCESISGYSYFADNEFSEIHGGVLEEPFEPGAESLLNKDFKFVLDKYMDPTQDLTPYYNTKEVNLKIEKLYRKLQPGLAKRILFGLLYAFQVICKTKNTKIIRKLILGSNNYDYLNTSGEAIRFYKKNVSPCDFTLNYIYVPLHYQPELSTVPIAGIYENQILIVRTLAKAIPDGYYLYVKEHAAQFQDRMSFPGNRDINYYKELLSIDCVRLIDTEVNTYDLMDHCVCVATATGTAAYEALYRDKQIIMFGGRFFQYAPGAYKVSSLKECKEAMSKIIKEKETYKTDRKRMADFLLKMQKVSFFRDIGEDAVIQVKREEENDKNRYAYELLIEELKDF